MKFVAWRHNITHYVLFFNYPYRTEYETHDFDESMTLCLIFCLEFWLAFFPFENKITCTEIALPSISCFYKWISIKHVQLFSKFIESVNCCNVGTPAMNVHFVRYWLVILWYVRFFLWYNEYIQNVNLQNYTLNNLFTPVSDFYPRF